MKKIIIGATLALLTLTGLTYADDSDGPKRGHERYGQMMDIHIQDDILVAIKANNYNLLTDKQKLKITQEVFALYVKRYQAHQLMKQALKDGNYTAFREAMIASIPTEAEFRTMVAKHNEKETSTQALENVIKNNDFPGFKTLITKKYLENGKQIPSDEKLKKYFDILVKKYQKTGKLPELRKYEKRHHDKK